jgi:hypothetical protein
VEEDAPFAADSPWTGAPRALLEKAIARHGGWPAWMRFRSVVVTVPALRGLVPRAKGFPRTFALPPEAEVRPHQRVAVFRDYPEEGRRGVFSNGAVQLETSAGEVQTAVGDPRATFRGLHKLARWSPLDALYFFGYALTHYHSLPFSLLAARPLRSCAVRFEGRLLSGVDVELPADLPTHCRRQSFYFESDGLLRRHDYVADIVGPFARGAHFWTNFTTVQGIAVARRRHVVLRLGRLTTPLVALHAELSYGESKDSSETRSMGLTR